jgi:hypothetical protein
VATKPIFFISHSSASLPATDRTVLVRDALADALDTRGWDVFLDRQVLQAGDRWRTNVLYGLARANAAAILFNDAAISQSAWVTAEAQILCFHKSVDPLFQLVPVLLERKTIQDTAFAKYQPFELNEIQGFPDDDTLPPEVVAARIADKFDIQQATTVPSRWCTRVGTLLAAIKDRRTLEGLAASLKLEIDARTRVSPADVVMEQLSNAIVAMLHHAEPLDIVESLADVFIPLDDLGRRQLHKCILAKWVPNESVEILLGATRLKKRRGVLTIGAMSGPATTQYVNRAMIEIQGHLVWAFSVAAAPGDTDDSIIAHVENTIREEMVKADFIDENGQPMALPRVIDQEVMSSPDDVAICVLPPSCSRASVLAKLLDDYPRLLFVAQPGSTDDLTVVERLYPRPLTPPYTTDRHNRLSRLMARVDAALTNATLR